MYTENGYRPGQRQKAGRDGNHFILSAKMSDHPQIKGFVHKHGCVCAAFDQEQLSPRNLPCHVPGVRNLHKIPGSGNEKYRCLDGLQLFFCDLRGMAEERGKLLPVPEEAARKRPMKNG